MEILKINSYINILRYILHLKALNVCKNHYLFLRSMSEVLKLCVAATRSVVNVGLGESWHKIEKQIIIINYNDD